MSDSLRKQIYNNLNLRDTEDLLEIWQVHDAGAWQPEVFAIVAEILTERLGYPPPPPSADEIQRLEAAVQSGEEVEPEEAEADFEPQDQTAHDLAAAYTRRGAGYDEAGDVINALADFRQAVRIDPQAEEAWMYLTNIEAGLEEAFQKSEARQRLDRAFSLAADGDVESAQVELAAALQAGLAEIAAAYNMLGNVYQALEQFEPAADAYLHAIRLNGRYYDARENLAAARLRLEEEQFTSSFTPDEDETEADDLDAADDPDGDDDPGDGDDPDEGVDSEDGDDDPPGGDPPDDDPPEPPDLADYEAGGPAPGWVYLSRQSYVLGGWPGHRNLPGRSGLDPLDMYIEEGHMEGVIIHMALIGRLRTHNPVYLLLMAAIGVIFSLPGLTSLVILLQGNGSAGKLFLFYSLPLIVGTALLTNVLLGLLSDRPEDFEDNGSAFY